jgi:hypothetical protein
MHAGGRPACDAAVLGEQYGSSLSASVARYCARYHSIESVWRK